MCLEVPLGHTRSPVYIYTQIQALVSVLACFSSGACSSSSSTRVVSVLACFSSGAQHQRLLTTTVRSFFFLGRMKTHAHPRRFVSALAIFSSDASLVHVKSCLRTFLKTRARHGAVALRQALLKLYKESVKALLRLS